MTSAVRTPAVAGRFYPSRAEELLGEVREFTSTSKTAIATGRVRRRMRRSTCGIHLLRRRRGRRLFAPANPWALRDSLPQSHGQGTSACHHGQHHMADSAGRSSGRRGHGCSVAASLPPALQEDSAAHRAEHAIEVQLPFLQALRPELKIVPIAVGTSNFDVLRGLGEALADVIADHHEKDRHEEDRREEDQREERPAKTLIIASSDMNHYESDAITRVKDRKAIERVLALDARGLWEVVMNEEISMCGFGPTIVMLTAAKILGATSATLVKYATSGDVSGDYESVVGYAGIIVE